MLATVDPPQNRAGLGASGAAWDRRSRLATRAPKATEMIIASVLDGMSGSLETGLDIEKNKFLEAVNTKDAQEGILAFLEKRAPQFKGE